MRPTRAVQRFSQRSSTGLRGMIRRPPCQPSACSNCVRPQSVQEHFGHALVEAWLLAADRLTDEGDGREDFSSRNVVARTRRLPLG